MKKLVLYGDSNTYGYDAERMGMRYPEGVRWASLVSEKLKDLYEVLNEGMNGRQLLQLPYDEQYLQPVFSDLGEGDILLIMLGTNDILLSWRPDAEDAIGRMEQFLSSAMVRERKYHLIIIAPPYAGVGDKSMHRYYEESVKMNQGFRRLCSEKKVHFADASEWNIPMAYDRVHFTAEGHRVFAGNVLRELEKIFNGGEK